MTTPSNSKFRTGSREAPTEPFKRAVTSCLRAIAKAPELEVTFASERPGLAPGKARLPEPARKMTRRDAAIVRGHADSIALKLACHDPKVHRKLMPGNPQARGVFEAVEQARVEALGSRRMAGVAKNLTAMLDDHFHRGKFDEITDRADAPLSDALAMLVRERLTGLAPPTAARKMVDLWRPLLEDKIGTRLDRLDRLAEDQASFDRRDVGERDGKRAGLHQRHLRRRRTRRRRDAGRSDAAEIARRQRAARAGISRVRAEIRRGHRGRGPLRPRRTRTVAQLPRQAARASARHRRAARQPLAAAFDGAAKPRLGIRPRGRHSGPCAAVARGDRSVSSALVHERKGSDFPRHRGDAASR